MNFDVEKLANLKWITNDGSAFVSSVNMTDKVYCLPNRCIYCDKPIISEEKAKKLYEILFQRYQERMQQQLVDWYQGKS